MYLSRYSTFLTNCKPKARLATRPYYQISALHHLIILIVKLIRFVNVAQDDSGVDRLIRSVARRRSVINGAGNWHVEFTVLRFRLKNHGFHSCSKLPVVFPCLLALRPGLSHTILSAVPMWLALFLLSSNSLLVPVFLYVELRTAIDLASCKYPYATLERVAYLSKSFIQHSCLQVDTLLVMGDPLVVHSID